MPNPTAPVLTAAFAIALGIFIVVALVRWRRRAAEPGTAAGPFHDPVHPAGFPVLSPADVTGNPYQVPAVPSPPPLPPPIRSGVPTWVYRKLDFIGAGLLFAIFGGLSLGNTTVDPEKISFTPEVLLGSIIFHLTLGVLTVVAVGFRVHPVTWLGLRWKNWPWVFLIAPATVLAMWLVFGGLQAIGYMDWMESLGVEATQDSVKLLQTATDPMVLILMAIAAVLVAPVCEEIVFRGYLYPVAKKYAGTWTAAICSGLVFAAAHGSLAALLPLFIFGIVLALLYEKTGSLWAPMAVHFCFNGATVGIQFLARQFPHLLDQAK